MRTETMELGTDATEPKRNCAGPITVHKPNCRQRSIVRRKQKNLKKAKKDNNVSKVTSLILSLRDVMMKQNKPQ
ncbi:hypothetical protein SLE2022_163440 [Rubroshorea leprosula]